MDAANHIAARRLDALNLADQLGSVTKACQRTGMSRTQFYEWRRRFQSEGIDGLRDRPPVHKSHPQVTPAETVARITAVALDHPGWGCDRIAEHLAQAGGGVSGPTAQKTLHRGGLGTREGRWLELERRFRDGEVELSEEQVAFIEEQNPAFRERRHLPSAPGQLLCATTLVVQAEKDYLRNMYVHLAVDAHSSFAFAALLPEKTATAASMLFMDRVLPFFQERGLFVRAVVTGKGAEFYTPGDHPYSSLLGHLGVEHIVAQTGEANGFAERMKRAIRRKLMDQITDRGPGLYSGDV